MERLETNDYEQTDFEEAIASIEQVYDSLKNYYDFLTNNDFGEQFMEAYDLEKEQIESHLDSVRTIILEYTKSILELIDGHVKWKEIDKNLTNFIWWLSNIMENSNQVNIFTLNFDLMLETILLNTIGPDRFMDFHVKQEHWDLLKADGKEDSDSSYKYRFKPDLANQIYSDRNIKLHHLHGSLSSFKEIKTGKIFKITTEVIIADELSHLCGVLSQSLQRIEPPFAGWRATIGQPLV